MLCVNQYWWEVESYFIITIGDKASEYEAILPYKLGLLCKQWAQLYILNKFRILSGKGCFLCAGVV